jgi:apolipoprotein N-acyltransferase
MLRATNTGATAVVRADGSVQARLADFTTGGLRARVETRRGQTPYLRLGDLPILLASLLVLALAIWRRLRG